MAAPANRERRGRSGWKASGLNYRPEAARPLQCCVVDFPRGLARKGCTLKRSRIGRAARTLVFVSLALSVSLAAAQSYPSKPIRLLLPFAGGTDAVARLLAFKLSPALGEQVLPEQRLGAGGNIAHRAAAEAPPDGYTLLMGAPPLVINPHLNPTAGYDALRAFAPVAPLTSIPNVLVVHPKVKAVSLAELLKRARAVLDSKRSSAMPEVPTAAEAGTALVAVNWYMLLAPAGTPRAVVDRLNAESVKAMNAADIRERLTGLGGEPTSGSPEDAAAFLRREYEQWGKVVREAGIKAE